MDIPDFTRLSDFVAVTLGIFLIVASRYFLVSGIFFLIFYFWFPEKWKHRKLNLKAYPRHQFVREVGWSMVTAFIFAVFGCVLFFLWVKGMVPVYTQLKAYPVWWLPVSLILAMLIQETYYYWLHRWMHLPKIFRKVHKVHHDSNITSPWTAFSFHPLEGILQGIFLPVLLLMLPMHVFVLLVFLSLMTLSAVINHLNIELYPGGFHKHTLGQWLIGSTHHALHHQQFKYNFGLYFTFWDKWSKTESPQYESRFEEKTGKPSAPGTEEIKNT